MRLTALLVAAVAPLGAFAMNVADVPVKCTSPEGKVSYQRGSCPPGNKIEITRADAPRASGPAKEWQFVKLRDSMTNATSCTASSPVFYINGKRGTTSTRLAIIFSQPGTPILLVRSESSDSIFHHNISGTGIKAGPGPMLPFSARPTQTVLSLAPGQNDAAIDALLTASTARVRVRIWPWDETYDSLEISLDGLKQAYGLAKHCATSL